MVQEGASGMMARYPDSLRKSAGFRMSDAVYLPNRNMPMTVGIFRTTEGYLARGFHSRKEFMNSWEFAHLPYIGMFEDVSAGFLIRADAWASRADPGIESVTEEDVLSVPPYRPLRSAEL